VVPTRVCQAIHQGMFRHFQMLRDVSDCIVAMVTRLSLLPTHHRQEPLMPFMRYKSVVLFYNPLHFDSLAPKHLLSHGFLSI
jgi:hypothetical protein